jgi:putative copper export protein
MYVALFSMLLEGAVSLELLIVSKSEKSLTTSSIQILVLLCFLLIMLLEFSVTNFRSIKEKQTLSLLKTKKNELENNFTAIPLSTGKNLLGFVGCLLDIDTAIHQ